MRGWPFAVGFGGNQMKSLSPARARRQMVLTITTVIVDLMALVAAFVAAYAFRVLEPKQVAEYVSLPSFTG